MQQPRPVAPMSITAGGNRNAKNVSFNSSGKRGWSSGLCGCLADCGTCLCACCCPCVVYAKVKHRLDHLNQYGRPDPKHGGGCCSGDCMLHCCLTSLLGAGWILQISSRGNVRSRYNIDGGCCGDCCTACWCTPCGLTQESREIELEEKSLR